MQKCAFILLVANLFDIINFKSANAQDEQKFYRNVTALQSLRTDILKGYDKFVRPAEHNETIKVDIRFTVARLTVGENKHTMSIKLLATMTWIDNKLKWNPSDYSGLSKIVFANHEIWQPDIRLENSATGNKQDILDYCQLVVQFNGEVLWVPHVVYIVPCNLDFTYWPFDKHTCLFKFRSWSQHSDELEITNDTGNNMTEAEYPEIDNLVGLSYLQEREWKLTHVKKLLYDKCCEEFSILNYWFTVTRESASYFFLLSCTSLAMEIMILLMFSYPLHSQMRLMISFFTAAYISIIVLYLSQRLPVMGYKTPRIVVFYSFHLAIVFLATIVSVFSHSICSITRLAPWKFMSIQNSPAGTFLCLQGQQDAHIEDLINGREETNGDIVLKSHHRTEWCLISIVLDRIIFAIYIITFLCLVVSFKF